MEQLQRRFEQGQIYTYIGDILLAVNPFTSLGLYSEHEQSRYRARARSDNQPHIFAVADAAYQALIHQLHNQAIVISGESGAGKTVSANLLLKQLVYLGKVSRCRAPEHFALRVEQLRHGVLETPDSSDVFRRNCWRGPPV